MHSLNGLDMNACIVLRGPWQSVDDGWGRKYRDYRQQDEVRILFYVQECARTRLKKFPSSWSSMTHMAIGASKNIKHFAIPKHDRVERKAQRGIPEK